MYEDRSVPLHHEGKAAIYRIFDADGNLLYVGITNNIWARMAKHCRSSAWWDRAVTVTWADLPTREQAEFLELTAIYSEKPEFNVNLRPTERRLRATPGAL